MDIEQRVKNLEEQMSASLAGQVIKTDVTPGSVLPPHLAINTTPSKGDLYYSDGSVFQVLPPGANTQILTLASGIPAWNAPAAPLAVSTAVISNPYKFSVYRAAAFNTGNNAITVIQYDTKLFDTGSNVDIITNKGRFTAPIAGFYQFNARFSIANTNSLNRIIIGMSKNGVSNSVSDGGDTTLTNLIIGVNVSQVMQLAANDFIEVTAFGSTALAMEVGQTKVYFSGFLISAT